VAILDARAAKFYTGEEAGQMPRGGHIPRAKSIPFSTLVDDKTTSSKARIRYGLYLARPA
jgi:3-mercaptopyruvate sulfurtransferase SseA